MNALGKSTRTPLPPPEAGVIRAGRRDYDESRLTGKEPPAAPQGDDQFIPKGGSSFKNVFCATVPKHI